MKTLHLMVTSLCNRNCEHCCNKQLGGLPEQVTEQDIAECDTLCITGGEPFLFANPGSLSRYYKEKYPNLKKMYVYTTVAAFTQWMKTSQTYEWIAASLKYFDGINLGVQNETDLKELNRALTLLSILIRESKNVSAFNDLENKPLQSNRIYVLGDDDFRGKVIEYATNRLDHHKISDYMVIVNRPWQEKFVPAENCIFKRV